MSYTDRDSTTGSINDTNSVTLEVGTSAAARVYLFVDDGTTGSQPAQYDLTVRGYSPPDHLDRYQFYFDEVGRTDRSWDWPAAGSKCEVELTNTSGGTATFEATLEARD